MLIDNFYDWALTLTIPDDSELEIEKVNFDKNPDSTLKKTIVIDIVNDQYIGKSVIWDDNSCFLEILEIDSEKNILHERFDFNNLKELKSKYKKYLIYFGVII
jgi:hypothetical protein